MWHPRDAGVWLGLGDVGVTSSKAQPSASKHSWVQNEPKQQRTNHNELMLGELRAGLPPRREQESCCSGSQVKHRQGKAALGKGIFLLVIHRT